ncbi:MAG: hypothetical protein QFX34_03660 [Candidatus Verstraetearchaeota archaeon]|nr:hypothetical protein [Candidatus Verstraetearchaeota archaeon]
MEKYDNRLYEEVGNALNNNTRFSYFYVSSCGNLFIPRYDHKDGLKYGSLTIDAFENRFIFSHISTALEKSLKSAEEGSLHEVEFIRHVEPSSPMKPVEFKGYFFAKESSIQLTPNNWIELEKLNGLEIQVGGERSYGFGKLVIAGMERAAETTDSSLFGDPDLEVALNDKPILRAKKGTFTLYAHMLTDCASSFKTFQGDIEPVLGREWDREKGAGWSLKPAQICFVPGTRVEADGCVEMEITEQGLWKLLPPQG